MKKTFYLRAKKNADREPLSPNLRGLCYVLGIVAVFGVIAILLNHFGSYDRLRARDLYQSGLEQIRQGNIIEGRDALVAAGNYRDAKKILEETQEEHARILIQQGEYMNGFELLQETDLNKVLILEKGIVDRLGLTDPQETSALAEQLLEALEEANEWENKNRLNSLIDLFVETSLLREDRKFLALMESHVYSEIFGMNESFRLDKESFDNVCRIMNSWGEMAPEELVASWTKIQEKHALAYHDSVFDYPNSYVNPIPGKKLRTYVFISEEKKHLQDQIRKMMKEAARDEEELSCTFEVTESGKTSVERCLEVLNDTENPVDAMVIYAHRATDYTEVIAAARRTRTFLWIWMDQSMNSIRKYMEGLYSVEQVDGWIVGQEYTLTASWPDKSTPRFYCILSTQYSDGTVGKIFRDVMGTWAIPHIECYRVNQAMDSAKKLLDAVKSWKPDQPNQNDFDAILVTPFLGAKYEQALQLAREKGLPVWIFSATDKNTMRENLLALYSEPFVSPEPTVTPTPTSTPVPSPTPTPTPKPTPEPTPEPTPTPVSPYEREKAQHQASYRGNLPWPTDETAPKIHVLFIHGSYLERSEELWSVYRKYLPEVSMSRNICNGALESQQSLIRAAELQDTDGILVFYYPGADYEEGIRLATENGIPVRFLYGKGEADLEEEIKALYPEMVPSEQILKRDFDYTLNLPWVTTPQRFYGYFLPYDQPAQDICLQTIDEVLDQYLGDRYRNYSFSWELKDGASVRNYLGTVEVVDAILVFPYARVDYSQAVEELTRRGIPVWFFGDDNPETIRRELTALMESDGELIRAKAVP